MARREGSFTIVSSTELDTKCRMGSIGGLCRGGRCQVPIVPSTTSRGDLVTITCSCFKGVVTGHVVDVKRDLPHRQLVKATVQAPVSPMHTVLTLDHVYTITRRVWTMVGFPSELVLLAFVRSSLARRVTRLSHLNIHSDVHTNNSIVTACPRHNAIQRHLSVAFQEEHIFPPRALSRIEPSVGLPMPARVDASNSELSWQSHAQPGC
ncbi:hypothetical protein BD311DRAFT_11351 [Dichomitus squalens]|uniref:Uncharacterized protein n=1 Tax=Dichomitus squalens TaxID=114155 RepID=A0A4Q9N8L2_9APHY|nr:hypothetical protein BD311DRAFT_11351 [Dichomitus squalens]